ncbi:hypothetical protein Y1Q_0008951 [Alligator mississippiensis]|uniref:Uncharacterized protein n=1 Tax=Alligator mississippiensis TaxID=8496 RepID=A0A151NKC5_ALLMI|nr:hypothetical protein Y1Q_0008951 [Alligator mississippiensis]
MWNRADGEFRVQFLALKCEWMEALWEQNAILARAVQAMDDDYCVLDTILALVVSFVLPSAWLLIVVLPTPWQPPATQQ